MSRLTSVHPFEMSVLSPEFGNLHAPTLPRPEFAAEAVEQRGHSLISPSKPPPVLGVLGIAAVAGLVYVLAK